VTAGALPGTVTEGLSYDSGEPRGTAPANTALNTNVVVTVRGSSFGGGDTSVGARVGGSAGEESVWLSDTALVCRCVIAYSQVGLALGL